MVLFCNRFTQIQLLSNCEAWIQEHCPQMGWMEQGRVATKVLYPYLVQKVLFSELKLTSKDVAYRLYYSQAKDIEDATEVWNIWKVSAPPCDIDDYKILV